MRKSRKHLLQPSNTHISILKQNCSDPRMHVALDLLAACDLKKELSIERLGQTLNLSASRLRHLFHEQLGFSPAQLFKWRRMQQSKELLTSTSMRIKEVMAAVGLNDASHFARDFKDMYGQAPSELRRQRYLQSSHHDRKPKGESAAAA